MNFLLLILPLLFASGDPEKICQSSVLPTLLDFKNPPEALIVDPMYLSAHLLETHLEHSGLKSKSFPEHPTVDMTSKPPVEGTELLKTIEENANITTVFFTIGSVGRTLVRLKPSERPSSHHFNPLTTRYEEYFYDSRKEMDLLKKMLAVRPNIRIIVLSGPNDNWLFQVKHSREFKNLGDRVQVFDNHINAIDQAKAEEMMNWGRNPSSP